MNLIDCVECNREIVFPLVNNENLIDCVKCNGETDFPLVNNKNLIECVDCTKEVISINNRNIDNNNNDYDNQNNADVPLFRGEFSVLLNGV